ncbi:site-specific integrase [Roseovarius arcticus]|uniref:site-specific integrase n=1 Tax=Roseovarius arcticus TaxID=2547404 RepID=UPI001110EF82|nr:site-specific integrase [Roseovarius arcticus]
MNRIERSPFANEDADGLELDGDGGQGRGAVEISFEQSIEAHDLALQSTACYSFEDLLQSGTWHKYEQRTAAIARKHPSRDPFISYLAMDAEGGWTTANSRQSDRSALTRMAARDVLELGPLYWRQMITGQKNEDDQRHLVQCLKPHLDVDVRGRMAGSQEPLSRDGLHQLSGAIAFLLQVRPDPHHTALRDRPAKKDTREDPGASSSTASQKTTLYALNQHQRRKAKTFPNYDWRSHFWGKAVILDDHLDDHRRARLAALMLTGCRPSEFSDDLGVTVYKVTDSDHPSLRFEIMGAKVSDDVGTHLGKGQEWRVIKLACLTAEALWLFHHMSKRNQSCLALEIAAKTRKQNGETLMPIERHHRVSVSLSKLVSRLGRIAFPRLRHNLTPYVFRHALTSDFKSGGHALEECDLAAALGHQSTRTQEHYGNANTARGLAGSRALQIREVRCSAPVRQPLRQGYASTEDMEVRPGHHPGASRPD